jgi:hypothetical protein
MGFILIPLAALQNLLPAPSAGVSRVVEMQSYLSSLKEITGQKCAKGCGDI